MGMKIQNGICPLCGEGSLNEILYADTLEIRKVDTLVEGLHASVCDACGETSMSISQVRENNKLVASVRCAAVENERERLQRLEGPKVKEIREFLGLTQQEASSVFGGGPKAFSKYECDQVIQSEAMDILMRVALEVPEAANWLLERAQIRRNNFVKPNFNHALWRKEPEESVQLLLIGKVANYRRGKNDDLHSAEYGKEWRDSSYKLVGNA
jgi:HTH-type transcriptional regulator/antitoxin MqsA